MEEFAEVFQDELGVLRGIEATVAINESATPRFHKVHPVPFALKERVERQLQQQVQEGELVPVDRSDWAAPIVVVHKKDGGIRICGDFKVSINPVLQSQTVVISSLIVFICLLYQFIYSGIVTFV